MSRRGFTRRTFLSAAALTGLSATVLSKGTASATPATLNVALANNTGNNTVYCYVTGMDPHNGNAWMFLQADGHTPYYPPSPSQPGTPLGADCSIALNASGSGPRTITLPKIVGGRVWFSIGAPLTFLVNPGPGIAMPSVTNPSDPNYDIDWGFCELTFDDSQLYGNITFVDFVSLPIACSLDTPQGTQIVRGLQPGGVDQMIAAMNSLGGDWPRLVSAGGRRVLSPNQAISVDGGLFAGYLDSYISQCWQHYASNDLTIDTQFTWGTVTGRVSGGVLQFPGVGSFTQPSTPAVFSCSQPPFTTNNDEMGNLSARLAAALNRTTLLSNPVQPTNENPGAFYQNAQTNHYARMVHQLTPDGLGYGFPYDDVHPSGVDFEGRVQSSEPGTLTISVGALH
ncbi:beta-1,3-glucanase [Labedaea rhizosphaerae]|uniref:Beta-1,3-glucanase n=2 Tax=Labedaea rhizosphaerae TaxID=598644 RepID=A0A4R6SE85_LABRH|nr:beta-1,3-glucanase [Labedaea rhizosphaerae]